MKRISFLSILFILALNSVAQVWCYPGAEWYYRRSSISGNGYAKLTYTGDVVFQSKTCHKIAYYSQFYYNTSQAIITSTSNYYTYTDNSVVYLYHSFVNQFDTLVNFNAALGDRWYFPEDDDCGFTKCEVIDTGHKVIQSQNLKWLKVKYNDVKTDSVYERIGNLGYFPADMVKGCMSDNPQGDPLRCYKDQQIQDFKKYSGDCNFIQVPSSLNELTLKNQITVYPNPVTNKLYIDSQMEYTFIQLTNTLGQIVIKSTGVSNTKELDLSDLPKGLYFLHVNADGKKRSYKVVKE